MPPVWTNTTTSVRPHGAALRRVDEAGHGLARVDRVEKDAFGPRHEPDGGTGLWREHAVVLADMVLVGDEVARIDREVEVERARRRGGHAGDVALARLFPADRADRRDARPAPQRAQARDEAGGRVVGAADEDVGGGRCLRPRTGSRARSPSRRSRAPPAPAGRGRRARSRRARRPAASRARAFSSSSGWILSMESMSTTVTSAPMRRSSSRLPCTFGPFTPCIRTSETARPSLRAAAVICRHPVGLGVGAGDHGVGARAQDLGEGELEMARLVAAEGEPGEVVALDVEGAHADRLRRAGGRHRAVSADARAVCADALRRGWRGLPSSPLPPHARALAPCHFSRRPARHPIAGGKCRATGGPATAARLTCRRSTGARGPRPLRP